MARVASLRVFFWYFSFAEKEKYMELFFPQRFHRTELRSLTRWEISKNNPSADREAQADGRRPPSDRKTQCITEM